MRSCDNDTEKTNELKCASPFRNVLEDFHVPKKGRYHNVLVEDSANTKFYLYDACGVFVEIVTGSGGAGSAPVISVNGEIGAIILDTDDLSDSGKTHRFVTADDLIKLAGIQAGAQVNAVTTVNGSVGDVVITKSTIALGNVDNTSDTAKNSAAVALTNHTVDATANKVTKTLYSVTIGASNADYNYNGTDIAVAINAAIDAAPVGGIDIFIRPGTYTIATPITMKNKANLQIRGAGKERTLITASGGNFSYFDMVNSSYRYKYRLAEFSLDNVTATAGSVAFDMELLSDTSFDNIVIKNFETGLSLANGMFYNSFYKVDTEDCNNAVVFTSGSLDQPNSNTFISCKFLSSPALINTKNGTSVNVNTITLNNGNNNSFISCQFENFNRALYINDVGNSFVSCRMESNDVTAANVFISIDANGKNNQFTGTYYSGNDYISRTSSIVDGGAGNSFYEGGTYKDQFVKMERNILGADDFVHYKRTGSGNGKAVVIAEDSYTPSGTPNQFEARSYRVGKFFRGLLNGVEKYFVDGNGKGWFAGGVDLNSQKAVNMLDPTTAQDGATKNYVDTGGWVAVPATATSTGIAGQKAYEAGYLYICVATNTWERVAIATW